MVFANARTILQRLREAYPPPLGRHHSLTLEEGSLVFSVVIRECWQLIRLTEEDLDDDVETVYAAIVQILEGSNGPSPRSIQRVTRDLIDYAPR